MSLKMISRLYKIVAVRYLCHQRRRRKSANMRESSLIQIIKCFVLIWLIGWLIVLSVYHTDLHQRVAIGKNDKLNIELSTSTCLMHKAEK